MSTIRRPTDVTPPGLDAKPAPASTRPLDERAATHEARYRHVDYDRHPLNVQGLDHYIERFETNERFRVW